MKKDGSNALVEAAPKPIVTSALALGVAIAVIGASFQYGYNIAVVNAPADEVKEFFYPVPDDVCGNTTIQLQQSNPENVTCDAKDSFENYQNNIYAIPVSAFAAAGMVGSLLVGPVVKRFGRLGGLMVNNILSVVAAIFLGVTKPANSIALLIIGRIIIGVFAGLATGVVPLYIAEISPKEWRGAIGVLNQLLITIGILIAQIFGLSSILGTQELWPYLFAFTMVPSLISMICYPVMPKSPRFLLIDRGEEENAKKTLIALRGTQNVGEEMEEMRREAAQEKSAGQMSIPQLFRDRSVRWQLITILLIMAAQQLSGINAVFFYSNLIFKSAGFKDSESQNLASVGVGAFNVFMTIVSVAIIERVGRKRLMVFGFGFMILWCLALTILLNMLRNQKSDEQSWISYACLVSLFGYIFGFAIGPGPVPWLITAELFRQAARPPAFMVACLLNWTCNFIIGISFPAVAAVTGPFVFILFMGVCVAITIYLQIVLPETKSKTFQEINDLFAKRNGIKTTVADDDGAKKILLQPMGGAEQSPLMQNPQQPAVTTEQTPGTVNVEVTGQGSPAELPSYSSEFHTDEPSQV